MRILSGTILSALALIATALPAQETTGQDATPAHGNSKVRIVRLSEVKGDVKLDRNNGGGFEAAMTNLPIVEQTKLETGVGAAEVEFEDNSTLRVAADSLVEFPQLELLPSGAKASTVTVVKGTAYASLVSTKGNDFTMTFGENKIHLQPSSHIRLQMGPDAATLSVLDGVATVESPNGTMEIAKKKAFRFDLTNQSPPVAAKSTALEPFDTWDHHAADYHKSFANVSAFGNSPNSYGVSDMLYYGSFANTGGCGSMWRPYFVSAAWDPFSNGTWAWYSGAGYSWVSPYPWGWMPFHYGSWISCPGAGWGWVPGGSWNGLGNEPIAMTTGGQPLPVTRKPAAPPVKGTSTLVVVNRNPLKISEYGSGENFVFRNDSAGMGIPRGNFGKLNTFSEETVHQGMVSLPVYMGLPVSGTDNRGTMDAGAFPASRGGPADPTMSSGTSPGSSMGRSTLATGPSIGGSTASPQSPAAPVAVTGTGTGGTATGKPR
jgi:FecR protein